MDDIQKQLESAEQAMAKAYKHTQVEFAKFNVGRANPNMLDRVVVGYYGNATPLNQMASVSTPDARTFVIKPWEKGHIAAIEKAILRSGLDLTPQNDGELIRISVPALTEERRKSLVKQVKNAAEKGRVGVRNIRKEVKEALKHLQKEGTAEDVIKKAEERLQELTDKYIHEIDQLLAHKEAEMMEV